MRKDEFEPWEIALIKAMLSEATIGGKGTRGERQRIQSYFSTPDHSINGGRFSGTYFADTFPQVTAATADELNRFRETVRLIGLSPAVELYRGNNPVVQVDYHFMPVGQGLFSAGQLRVGGLRPFRWVFDCGTISSGVDMTLAITNCPVVPPPDRGGKGQIDILAISHFHEDHISGMVALLQLCRIEVVLLPYLTPEDRVLLLMQSGANAGSDYSQFLRNPVGFVAERGEVGQILLVQPESDAPPEAERGDPADLKDDWKLVIPAPQAPSAHHKLPDPQLQGAANLLPKNAVLTLSGIWEFVPYCDKKFDILFDQPFLNIAKTLADKFIAQGLQSDLDGLRKLYDKATAAKSGKPNHSKQNHISLHLYTGPIGAIRASDLFVSGSATQAAGGPFRLSGPDQSRIGQLLTGDGSFKKQAFDRVRGVLDTSGRWKRGAVFQVPHHGSKENWHVGAAALLQPRLAVFSSDDSGFRPSGASKGHPDQMVWQDLLSFVPLRVNLTDGCVVSAAFSF